MNVLHVWRQGRHVGVFAKNGDIIKFAYDKPVSTPISLSLPVGGPHSRTAPTAFLENLLPEDSSARWRMADRLEVDSTDTFDLLANADTVGGLVFSESETLPTPRGEVRPISEEEFAAQIRQSGAAGHNWFARGDHCRFSLAGGQPKFSVARVGGNWLWPNALIPSTHIVKPPVKDCPGSDRVENATLELGRLCGFEVSDHDVITPCDTSALIIERFDRTVFNNAVQRLHCEDIAQAMGAMPEQKYDIGAVECIRFLSRFGTELPYEFVHRLAFNVSSGGSDAHGKNYSLMLGDDGICFSPMYDTIITRTWPHLDQDLAMRVNDKEFAEWVTPDDWRQLAKQSGLDADRVVHIARTTAGTVLDHAEEIAGLIAPTQRDQAMKALAKANASIQPLHEGVGMPAVQSKGHYRGGDVWVNAHVRDGHHVNGYWRHAPTR